MRRIDLSGQRFGRLTVTHGPPSTKHGKTYWPCRCDCGNPTEVYYYHLKSGQTVSCGCYGKEQRLKALTTHGEAHVSKAWAKWAGMRNRCSESNKTGAKYYFDRGITVCDRWSKFTNFLADMGEPPPEYELDRIDNDKGYAPDNCRWVDHLTQSRNKRRNKILTHDGKSLSIPEWAELVGINAKTLAARVRQGWATDKVLEQPLRKWGV